MNNKIRRFSPTELYENYLKDDLRADSVNKILNNENFSSFKEKEIALQGFVNYVIDVHKNNLELDDQAMNELNKTALMYLGLIQNKENEKNYIQDEKIRKELGKKVIENMLTSRSIDRSFLASLYSMREKNNKDFKDFFDEKTSDLLDAKIQKAVSLKTEQKTDLLDFYLKRSDRENVSIDELKVKYKDDYEMLSVLDDINNTELVNEKNKLSISETNENLFLKEDIIQRDYLFWQKKFNEKIEKMNLEKQNITDQIAAKIYNVNKLNDNGKNFSLFSNNYVVRNPDTGIVQSVIEIPKNSKKIISPSMPQDDAVYEAMAIGSKMQGIKEPVINVNERSAENRKEFVQKTIRELLKVGYDIDSITVPKDLEEYRLAFKQLAQGISERGELTEENIHTLNASKPSIDEPVNSNGNKENIAQELKDLASNNENKERSAEEILNAGNLGKNKPIKKNKPMQVNLEGEMEPPLDNAQEVEPPLDNDQEMGPPFNQDSHEALLREAHNSNGQFQNPDVNDNKSENSYLEKDSIGHQLLSLAISRANDNNVFQRNLSSMLEKFDISSKKYFKDKESREKAMRSDFANTAKDKIIDKILFNKDVLRIDPSQIELLQSNMENKERINKKVCFAINEALKDLNDQGLVSPELQAYIEGQFKKKDMFDMSNFNVKNKSKNNSLKAQ